MRPFLLLASILVLVNVSAQIDLTTLTCEDAIEFCPEGILFKTINTPDEGHPGFCSSNDLIHNPRYLKFVPVSDTVDLSIEITGCSSGSQLQFAVIDTCDWQNTDVVVCESLFRDTTSEMMTSLTIGKVYYLVVDGANAATCSYRVSLNNIAAASNGGHLGPLIAPTVITEAEELQLSLPAASQDDLYLWSVPWLAQKVATDTAYLTITIPSGLQFGDYEICVTAAAACKMEECVTTSINVIGANFTSLICEKAIEFCMDGVLLETDVGPDIGHESFCGLNTRIDNPSFLKFVPTSSTVDLSIDVVDCYQGSAALQYAVIDTCIWTNDDVIACDASFVSTTTATMNGLTIGKEYYIVVDGSNGARCSYSLKMSNIAGNTYSGVLDTVIALDTIAGNQELILSLGPGAIQNTLYHWTIPWLKERVTTDTAFLSIDVPCALAEIEQQVCVNPAIGCHQQVCATTFIQPSFEISLDDIVMTLMLPETGDTVLSGADLVFPFGACTDGIQVSFARNAYIPAIIFNCSAIQANGGPYFQWTLWISDLYGNVLRVPVAITVLDPFGHCVQTDVPRDTLQHDTSGVSETPLPTDNQISRPTFSAQWTPNPWRSSTLLSVTSKHTTQGVLTLTNSLGQIVYKDVLEIQQGTSQFTILQSDVGQTGLLLYHLRVGPHVQSGKLLLVK